MAEVEDNQSQNSTPMVTISYIPLFYPQWPFGELTTKWQKKKVVRALVKFIDDAVSLGNADVCAWTWAEDHDTPVDPRPILVLPRSLEIYKHLNWWSQDKPEEFFQFAVYYDIEGKWYTCALMPNLTKSMSRVTFNFNEVAPELEVSTKDATVLFVPLTFSSGPMSVIDTLIERGGVLPQAGDKIDIGLLDSALLNHDHGLGNAPYNHDDVYWLRDIPVVNADEYLKNGTQPQAQADTPDRASYLWCDEGIKIINDLLEG